MTTKRVTKIAKAVKEAVKPAKKVENVEPKETKKVEKVSTEGSLKKPVLKEKPQPKFTQVGTNNQKREIVGE